jgi:hypothetical protein
LLRAGLEVGEQSAIDERLAQYEALQVEEAVQGTAVTTQRTQGAKNDSRGFDR